MITETIALIIGIILGQEAGLPSLRPFLVALYTKLTNKPEETGPNPFLESLKDFFNKKD